jgi:3-deoxy-manno-octulosonate cytidylyltransferase (CMP-KDO synthetase)
MEFTVVIPARFASKRLPGKPLIEIAGRPMIEWVWRRAIGSKATRVVVATDDQRILGVCKDIGAEAYLTSIKHPSGTDRIAEVANILGLSNEHLVVNLQGDEPLIPTSVIDQVAKNLYLNPQAELSTLCEPIMTDYEFSDPNVVKVVMDSKGFALYFSRASVPHDAKQAQSSEENNLRFRHLGIYAYRKSFLSKFSNWNPTSLEKLESLEQLRALHYGARIHVELACETVPGGIDTEDDLSAVRELLI